MNGGRGCEVTLVNGKPKGKIWASRSFRQGHLLSPFLFIIVVDVLSRLVSKCVKGRILEPFEVGKEKVKLSSFAMVIPTRFFCLNHIIIFFEEMLGLKINRGKSCVMGTNSKEEKIKRCVEWIGCNVGSLPPSYLGLPFGNNPKSVAFWDPV